MGTPASSWRRLEVPGRIGQPVRVVDAQPVDDPVGHQLQDLGVGPVEDLGVLLAHAGQAVDVEEPAVPAGLRVDVEHHGALVLVRPPGRLVGGRQVVRHDVEQHAETGGAAAAASERRPASPPRSPDTRVGSVPS